MPLQPRYAFRRSLLPEWAQTESLIWLRAVGNSMEPTLHDADLLLLDRSQTEPVDGCLVVVRRADDLVVKRLRHSGQKNNGPRWVDFLRTVYSSLPASWYSSHLRSVANIL